MDAPAATGEYSHAHELANTKASVEYTQTTSSKPRIWVDPATLPVHTHPTPVGGNAPDYVKRLNYNTVMFYGVGVEGSFGERVGRAIRFVDVSLRRSGAVECSENGGEGAEGRLEATTTAEVEVTKREFLDLYVYVFGANFRSVIDFRYVEWRGDAAWRVRCVLDRQLLQHAACRAWHPEKRQWCWCHAEHVHSISLPRALVSFPLQSHHALNNKCSHRGTILQIVSTSIAMGGRVMSSRCEVGRPRVSDFTYLTNPE